MTHGQSDIVPELQRAVRAMAPNRKAIARLIEGFREMAEREAEAMGATEQLAAPARAVRNRKPMTTTPED